MVRRFANVTLIVITLVTLALALSQAPAHAQTQKNEVTLPSFNIRAPTSPATFANYFFVAGLAIGGILAFAMIVIGGIEYAISGGNSSRQSDAMDRIREAITGLLLLLFSYLILKTINPNLVNLQNPASPPLPVTQPGPLPVKLHPANWDQGWKWTSDASSEKQDASPQLQQLLSCMGLYFDSQNVNRSSVSITSISDINIYRGACDPNIKNPSANYFSNSAHCQHTQYSCHYGGPGGFKEGAGSSYAFDAVPSDTNTFINAAHSCNAHVADEKTHLHTTIGYLYASCDLLFGQ